LIPGAAIEGPAVGFLSAALTVGTLSIPLFEEEGCVGILILAINILYPCGDFGRLISGGHLTVVPTDT